MEKYNKEKILIIGGAGYVGSALCEKYAAKNIRFQILDHFTDSLTSTKLCRELGWQYAVCNILDTQALKNELRKFRPTKVVHLAALHYIPYCNEHPTETVQTNIVGLQNVIDAIHEYDDSVELLFSSSAAVYASRAAKLNENDVLCPSDIYGLTKYAGENMIIRQTKAYKIARLFNVYGQQDPHEHLVPKVYRQGVLKDQKNICLGASDTVRDYIHVNDVAAGLLAIQFTLTATRIFNIGSGTAHSVTEIVDTILQRISSPPKVIYMQREHLRKDDKPYLCSDSSLLIKETGWKPTYSLEESIGTVR